ncbi:MAG: apolipoprotein N-acyltransferase [Desulfobacterales bacterium]|nr:apolipoprotein N-acyltransferase [Desulfobacterales bacterium]
MTTPAPLFRHNRSRVALALVSSLLLVLAAPGLGDLWPLAWIGLVPLLLAIRSRSPVRAAGLGFVAGLLYYIVLLSWVVIALGRYGNLPWWLSLAALFLLAAYMAGYFAVFAAIVAWGQRRNLPLLWIGPWLWVVLDFLRGRLFSGFPWQDLAYTQYRVPGLIQVADLTGHYGVTFLIVLVNCLIFQLFLVFLPRSAGAESAACRSMRNQATLVAAVALLAGALFYNGLRSAQVAAVVATAPTLEVAVVQGNIPQERKWNPLMQRRTLEIYTDLSQQALAETGNPDTLLIWPETALPFYPRTSPLFGELCRDFVKRNQLWLLTGTPYFQTSATGEVHYFNSSLLLDPQGKSSGRYDKQHLVPFGEYMPLRRYLPLPRALVESVGDFTPGAARPPLSCQKARIGVLICFESIFPELARAWARQGATLLVNQTNDAWYGRSGAPWQHLSNAVFRAIETRRSLARAANTGVSGFVDPLGRLTATSPLFEPCYLTAALPLLDEKTFYVRHGPWFVWLCAGVVLLGAGTGFARHRRDGSNGC